MTSLRQDFSDRRISTSGDDVHTKLDKAERARDEATAKVEELLKRVGEVSVQLNDSLQANQSLGQRATEAEAKLAAATDALQAAESASQELREQLAAAAQENETLRSDAAAKSEEKASEKPEGDQGDKASS